MSRPAPLRFSLWTWGPRGGFVHVKFFHTRGAAVRHYASAEGALSYLWRTGETRGAVVLYRPDGGIFLQRAYGFHVPQTRPVVGSVTLSGPLPLAEPSSQHVQPGELERQASRVSAGAC
jgi:hypothetical protein